MRLVAAGVGVFAASFSIFFLHQLFVEDVCFDAGGFFNKSIGECIDGDTYEDMYIVLTWQMMAVYAGIALTIWAITSRVALMVRRLWSIRL